MIEQAIRIFKKIRFSLLGTVLLFLVTSCSAQKPTKSSSYSEDLSGNRPKFVVQEDSARKIVPVDSFQQPTIKPTHFVNEKVDVVLDSISRFNLTKRFVDGFTAQIYSGQKKEDAMNTKQKLSENAPELVGNLQYVQPKFRVTVGHYLTRLEAQKDLQRLKRLFPQAILVPEKIQIR